MPLSKSLTTVTPLSKALALVLFFALPILGFCLGAKYAYKLPMSSKGVTPASSAGSQLSLLIGPFTGQLPCADCSGIESTLTLERQAQGADMGTYTYSQTYMGKDVPPYVSKGTWTVLRGDKSDPNATVYQITDDSDNSRQYFLKIGETQVQMLDQDQGPIDGPGNYTLTISEAP